MIYKKYIKRVLDITGAIIAMPFVLIICMVIGPLIIIEDKGSVFYKAKRRGLNGRVFTMYKFRSMRMNAPDIRNADNSTYNAPDDPRITKIGRILRRTSIDELPQIFNIIKGDMSWIGPRPVTTDKPLDEYDQKRIKRLTVRPGITGYQQAFFRNSINQERKFELDAEYADKICFLLDFRIAIKTIQTVILQKNIYNGEAK